VAGQRRKSLIVAVAALLLAGCGGGKAYTSTRGAHIVRFTVHSVFLHRDLHEIFVVPPRHDPHRWLLVLLHGRGAGPTQFLMQPLFDELAALGRRAPYVLLLDGGDHSYWHDRKDGPWGMETIDEAILAGVGRANTAKVALGGISMGGYGALLLGSGANCAVGAHSPAIWQRAADTAPGAFDDAADFARNDIFDHPPSYGHTPVWIDVGASDPFHDTDVAYARKIHAQLHVWPGGHVTSYWRAHVASYLRFYADACA
jgi:pimeloyl-ACP methyl ester carboxylesterase